MSVYSFQKLDAFRANTFCLWLDNREYSLWTPQCGIAFNRFNLKYEARMPEILKKQVKETYPATSEICQRKDKIPFTTPGRPLQNVMHNVY